MPLDQDLEGWDFQLSGGFAMGWLHTTKLNILVVWGLGYFYSLTNLEDFTSKLYCLDGSTVYPF